MQSTSSSMGEIEVPPNTPTSANSEPNIAPKTPIFANIENESIKEANKLEGNLKETQKPVEAVKDIGGIFSLDELDEMVVEFYSWFHLAA